MKKRLILLILYTLLVFIPLNVNGAMNSNNHLSTKDKKMVDELLFVWNNAANNIENKIIDEIIRYRDSIGSQNLLSASKIVTDKSIGFYNNEHNKDMAIKTLLDSIKISPLDYSPYFYISDMIIENDFNDADKSFRYLFQGIYNYLNSFYERNLFFLAILVCMLSAFFLSIIIFIITTYINYIPLFCLQIKQSLLKVKGSNKIIDIFLYTSILILPFLYTGLFSLVLIPLILINHVNIRLKVFFLCSLILIPLLLIYTRAELKEIEIYQLPEYKLVSNISLNIWDDTTYSELMKLYSKHSASPAIMYAIGFISLKMGNYDESIKFSRKILDINPSHLGTLINIGNAYFKKGDYKDAIKYYNYASNLEPDRFESHYNLSTVYYKLLETVKSEEEYEKAALINKEMAMKLSGKKGPAVLDINISSKDIERFKNGYLRKDSSPFTSLLFKNQAVKYNITAFVLFLLFLFYLYKEGSAYLCPKCLSLTYHYKDLQLTNSNLCRTCYLVNSADAGIDQEMISDLKAQIRGNREKKITLCNILNILLPGMGLMISGIYFRGLMLSVISLVIVYLIMFSLLKLITYPFIPFYLYSMLLSLIIFYILINLFVYKEAHKTR